MGRELFICENAAFVIPVCPRLVYGNAVFAHLVKYCILPLPTKMSRNSVCPRQVSHFCGLDKSPALDNALSILLSSCSQHFFRVCVFASFIHLLPVVTLTDNESEQIAVARSFRMSALLTPTSFPGSLFSASIVVNDNGGREERPWERGCFNTKNFFSEGQKILVNSEDKENLSNYQLLKRKPSVSSSSLHFSKLITVVQFFFPVTPVLQWFQLNFGAGNFRGRRPGSSALHVLRRLTAVSVTPTNAYLVLPF